MSIEVENAFICCGREGEKDDLQLKDGEKGRFIMRRVWKEETWPAFNNPLLLDLIARLLSLIAATTRVWVS